MKLSDKMRALLDKLTTLEGESKNLINKEDATAEEINGKITDIKAHKAKINAQKEIEALEAEREKARNTPVNTPIHARRAEESEKIWNGMGEFLGAVARASSPGGSIDDRLSLQNSALGMNESVSSEGGFLVENDFIKELFESMITESQVANRIRMIPIGANKNRLRALGIDENSRENGSRWGGVQAYWAGEAETVKSSKPKFKEFEISLQKLMALCYVTDELLEDATALEAIVRQAYAEEMSFKVDDAIINGTGVGMPLGILNSEAVVSVAKEKEQGAKTIVYENILKMWSRMPARLRKNAVWYINQEIEPQLYALSLKIGNGGVPVFLPAGGAAGAQYSTLFSRPIIPIEQCSELGKKGDIILADPKQYVGIDKKALQSDVSIHVRFLYDEQVFRFIYKFNGQPYKKKPIKPYKGSNTMSPFIVLADR